MPSLFPTDPTQLRAPAGRPANVPFARSWQFDHTAGEVVIDPAGRVATCEDVEAYRQWALRTLLTERYQHPIYSRQHGTELGAMLRQGLSPGVLRSEIIRTITEALMVDPRTRSVGEFAFARKGAALEVSFSVRTARDETLTITVPVGGGVA